LQLFRMGGCQTQHRLEYMRFMVPNSVGGVQTIIAQFFDRDNGAFTVWELHFYFVFLKLYCMQPAEVGAPNAGRQAQRERGTSGRWQPSPSGRSAARATVGGEFPTGTLSVVPRVPSSPLVHVSASPPLIPDGRLSRVRLAASDVWVLSRRSLPLRHGGLSAHSHTPLIRLVYCTASQRLR
jgi:hypothetical protein